MKKSNAVNRLSLIQNFFTAYQEPYNFPPGDYQPIEIPRWFTNLQQAYETLNLPRLLDIEPSEITSLSTTSSEELINPKLAKNAAEAIAAFIEQLRQQEGAIDAEEQVFLLNLLRNHLVPFTAELMGAKIIKENDQRNRRQQQLQVQGPYHEAMQIYNVTPSAPPAQSQDMPSTYIPVDPNFFAQIQQPSSRYVPTAEANLYSPTQTQLAPKKPIKRQTFYQAHWDCPLYLDYYTTQGLLDILELSAYASFELAKLAAGGIHAVSHLGGGGGGHHGNPFEFVVAIGSFFVGVFVAIATGIKAATKLILHSTAAKMAAAGTYGLLIIPRLFYKTYKDLRNIITGYKRERAVFRFTARTLGIALGVIIGLALTPVGGGPHTALALGIFFGWLFQEGAKKITHWWTKRQATRENIGIDLSTDNTIKKTTFDHIANKLQLNEDTKKQVKQKLTHQWTNAEKYRLTEKERLILTDHKAQWHYDLASVKEVLNQLTILAFCIKAHTLKNKNVFEKMVYFMWGCYAHGDLLNTIEKSITLIKQGKFCDNEHAENGAQGLLNKYGIHLTFDSTKPSTTPNISEKSPQVTTLDLQNFRATS